MVSKSKYQFMFQVNSQKEKGKLSKSLSCAATNSLSMEDLQMIPDTNCKLIAIPAGWESEPEDK